jgi:hypothetical protein
MNKKEEMLAIGGCSVHMEQEFRQPRENRDLRGRVREAQIAQLRQM